MLRVEASAADVEGIVPACTDYIASWLEGDRDRMASCLHSGLVKRTVADPASGSLELIESPYARMLASAARGPRPYARDVRIEVHDVRAGIASASVLSEPWLDLVHLAWFGDRWRIVNVLYEPRAAISPADGAAVDTSADHAAVAALLDAYAAAGFDDDVEAILATHHPALAERRVVVGAQDGLELEDTSRDEVVEIVRRGLAMERFERAWDARVLEMGRDVAAARVVVGWYDVDLHLARFGDRWLVVNILYRTLQVDP